MRRRPVPDLPPEAFALHGPVSQNAELPRSQPAEAVRDLIDLLMTKDLDDEVLLAEAEVLRGVVDRLEQAGGEGRRSRTTPMNHRKAMPANGIRLMARTTRSRPADSHAPSSSASGD